MMVPNSNDYTTEMEIIRLRANNDSLTKMYARVLEKNSQLQTENRALHMEIFELSRKLKTMEHKLKHFIHNINEFVPNYWDVLKVTENNEVVDSEENVSMPAKIKTIHAIKPHAVNGTVLNVNPTITLPRLDISTALSHSSNLPISNDHNEIEIDQTTHNTTHVLSVITNHITQEEQSTNQTTTIRELQISLPRLNHIDLRGSIANSESSTRSTLTKKRNTKSKKRKSSNENTVPKKKKISYGKDDSDSIQCEEEPQRKSSRTIKPINFKMPSLKVKLRRDF